MLINLIIGLFLGFELQKLIQFNFFFRIKCVVSDYYNYIILRKESAVLKEIAKLGVVDFFY